MRASLALVACAIAVGGLQAPAAFAESKPVNTVLPSVSGPTREGGTLKVSKGSWSGGGALIPHYQWQRCETPTFCTSILGASEQTYTEALADVGSTMRALVTVENKVGSGEATSAETAMVAGIGPKDESAPTLSGEAVEGQVLTLHPGTWGGTAPLNFTYEWERCKEPEGKACTTIAGEGGLTYRVQTADLGQEIRVKVTAKNHIVVLNEKGEREEREEKAAVKTAPTAAVTAGPPSILGLPSIAGDLREGHTLTAVTGEWRGQPTITYSDQWKSCNGVGACTTTSGSTYTLGATDVGNTIKLSVTASNALGSLTSSSVASQPVLAAGERFTVGWGEDSKGQLGTLYKAPFETTPVLNEGGQNAAALSAGTLVSYVLHVGGAVTAEGAGGEGALGDGLRNATWELGKSHVTVEGLEAVSEVSGGGDYALAREENGDIEAWGSNFLAQLGNGTGGFEHETGENTHTPKEVLDLHGRGATSIASGGKANFAVLSSGEVDAWGYNNFGELGVEWPASCEAVKTCEPEVKKHHEETKTGTGEHLCFTEIGHGGQLCSKRPKPVLAVDTETEKVPLQHVERVIPGTNATYALLESGEVDSWGSDSRGQLGQEMEPTPGSKFIAPGRVMVGKGEPLRHVVAVAAGNSFAIALLESGEVVGWGEDREGQIGEAAGVCKDPHAGGTWLCDRYATVLAGLAGVHVTAIAAGSAFSAALGEDGTVRTVGQNNFGELGIGAKCENAGGELGFGNPCWYTHWQTIAGLEHVVAISAEGKVALAEVGGEGAPQPPVAATEAGADAITVELSPPAGETPVRIASGLWEHPTEEGAEPEEGSSEEPPGGTTGAAPTNETEPMLKEFEMVGGELVKVHNDVVVGNYLEATTGNWLPHESLNFSYRWLRCKGGKCATLRGWTEGGKEHKGELLQIPEQDNQGNSMIGDTIKVEVAAWHENEVAGFATSPVTEETVREGREGSENTNLEGANGFLFDSLAEAPLVETSQYELKLYTENAAKEQLGRDFVVKP